MLAPVLIAVTALLSPMAREAHATTRGRGCHRQCASTFIDTLEQQCASCAPGIIAARKECNQRANGLFDTCKGQCPGFPGRCTITRECVNGCRDQRTGRGGKCAHQFMRRLRRCSGSGQCLAGARKARRQCLRLCRLGLSPSAPATEAPPAATSSASSGAGGPGCRCQPDCIVGIVGGCYDDCNDRCDGDGDALAICRRACRDAQCTELENQCRQGGSSAHPYEKCCTTCGNCATAVSCTPTTSTTTVTRVSTTSTTTSTTTPASPRARWWVRRAEAVAAASASCCAHSPAPPRASPLPRRPSSARPMLSVPPARPARAALRDVPFTCGVVNQSACVLPCP